MVLDAAAAFGLEPDGRLFALNSYENRVYQLGSDTCTLVLKFYRPARWSDAQISEEHEFTAELAAAELPVAAPLRHRRAHAAALSVIFASPPSPSCAGAPRSWMPRKPARSSAAALRGCTRSAPGAPSPCARASGCERLGWEARAQVLESELLPRAAA